MDQVIIWPTINKLRPLKKLMNHETLYGDVKSSILSRTPLPSLDEAYNILTHDEESKPLSRLHEDRAGGVGFAVQTQN